MESMDYKLEEIKIIKEKKEEEEFI